MAKKNIIGVPSDISMYANQFSILGRPLTRELDDEVDVVIMGIPFDMGTTGRPGTRYEWLAVIIVGKINVGHGISIRLIMSTLLTTGILTILLDNQKMR